MLEQATLFCAFLVGHLAGHMMHSLVLIFATRCSTDCNGTMGAAILDHGCCHIGQLPRQGVCRCEN